MEVFEGLYQLFRKQSKIFGLIGFLILACLMGYANPQMTSDYQAYEYYYYFSGATGAFYFERGYSLIARYFYMLGISYQDFRFIISIVGCLILYFAILRFTKNVSFFVFVYGFTAFFLDATQLRNFLMISIVTFAISFLGNSTSIKNYFICIALILISAQIHSTGYFFLLVPILNIIPFKKIEKNFIVIISIIVVSVTFLLFVGRSYLTRLLIITVGHINSRADLAQRVMTKYSNGSGKLILLEMVLVTLLVFVLGYYLVKKCSNIKLKKKLIPLFWGLFMSVLALPLLSLAVDYSRIMRNTFVFLILLLSVFYEKPQQFNVNKNLVSRLVLIVCFVFAYTHNTAWGVTFTQSIPYLIKLK